MFWRESKIRVPAKHKGHGASSQVLLLNRRGLQALVRFAEYRRTRDPLVVQQLMLHRSSETTRRYILGAVPDVVQRAVDAVDGQLAAGSTGWQSGADTPHTAPKWLKQLERETGFEPATFSLGS